VLLRGVGGCRVLLLTIVLDIILLKVYATSVVAAPAAQNRIGIVSGTPHRVGLHMVDRKSGQIGLFVAVKATNAVPCCQALLLLHYGAVCHRMNQILTRVWACVKNLIGFCPCRRPNGMMKTITCRLCSLSMSCFLYCVDFLSQ
jgi:hypothetical protein